MIDIRYLIGNITEEDSDRLSLSSGNCLPFAISLGLLSGLEYSVSLCFREEVYDEDFKTTAFSHAVLIINGVDYDANGADAKINWESSFDDQLSDEYENQFHWVDLDIPDLEDCLEKIQSVGCSSNHTLSVKDMITEISKLSKKRQPRPAIL